jgi:hypothetical protein
MDLEQPARDDLPRRTFNELDGGNGRYAWAQRTPSRVSILNQHRAPLITLTYKTVEEADLARSVVEAVLRGVIDVISHPDPSRL